MKYLAIILFTLLLVPWGPPVAACSLSDDAFRGWDWPIIARDNCSFIRAGESPYYDVAGSYALDLGNGRVAQRVSEQSFCMRVLDYMLVVECHSREAIMTKTEKQSLRMLRGFREPEDVFPNEVTSASFKWVPGGSLDAVRHSAVERGYEVISASDFVAGMKRRNRFDPFCGCKHFYPDAEGAKK